MDRINCRLSVKCILVGVFSLFSLFFFSCENFMDSSVKDEIVNDIYIANNECPVAKVEEPIMTDKGVEKNKAIVISFSIPVDPKTFDQNFKIIDSAGYDLKPYFLEPQWANGNKLVTIPADELNLINLNGSDTLDITISLSTNIKTKDDPPLPLKAPVNHKYRINNNIDNTAPVIAAASYMERPEIKYRNIIISDSIKLVEGAITAETEENICKTNHINTSVKVYIEGSDYGGGAVKGHVKYHRVNDPTGIPVKEEEEDIIINLTRIEGKENSSGTVDIDLSDSQKYQDGMYEIKVSILDSYGKESSNSIIYNVIRDTKLPYCVTSRFVNDTPYFRDDIDTDNYWIKTFNSQVPTVNKILSFKKHVLLDKISDDVYYTSKLTKKEYGDKQEDFSYFLSWGLSLDSLTAVPVKLEGEINHDILVSLAVDSIKIYTVPDDFLNFMKNNESKDIIASVTIMDPMGNQNVIYALYPKKIDFHNYVVSDDAENAGKKKVELNFAEIINEKNIPNSSFRSKFRIFYAPLGNLAEDADTSELELKRNWLLPFSQNNNDSARDSNIIKNLEPGTKYVVYIQSVFDADSTLNGQWTGTTFGPLERIIVDTGKNAGGNIVKPEFEIIKKESAGINTGLLKITVKVNDDVYNANKALGVKYIPSFKPHSVFINDEHALQLGEWTSYEANSNQEFTFFIKTPVRAPFGLGESWDSDYWDGPVVYLDGERNRVSGPGEGITTEIWGDYTYIQAVRNCLDHGLNYVDSTKNNVTGYFKLVAVVDGLSVESDEVTYEFEESDDNIPPKIQSDIVLHDSRLSYDGHSFEYDNIIREEEGHLSEFYQWYYTPYNPAWGDNLSVMTPEEIERLPGGITSYTGSAFLGHEDEDGNKNKTPHGARYNLYMSIPVFGLPDGDYMYFAKVTDTYGNYTYVTLGKGHIGTFKNKLKVELAENEKHFVSTLELAPDEEHFDRNMISVKRFGPDADEPSNSKWNDQYEWLNELQNCEKKTQNGKTVLYNNNNEAGDNVFILDWKTASPDDDRLTLDTWNFYKITMQSFNENSLEGYWDNNGQAIITRPGVDRIYGRPYNYSYDAAKDEYSDIFGKDVLGWVDGETQYDVCIEETVSNTVYFYVPGKGYDNNGNRHPEWDEDFNDFYASFFASSAIARSNHNFIVNVIASSTDLGNDIDEWERRGKLVKTHFYSPNKPTDSWYNPEFDMNVNPFDYNVASNDVADSHEKGLIYYVAVAHFADNSSAISDVFTMYGF